MFLTIVAGGILTIAVNGLFVLALRRAVQESHDHTAQAIGSLISIVARYREVAEGALAALTRRAEEADKGVDDLVGTQEGLGRSLQRVSEVLNEHFLRSDGNARLIAAQQDEIRYLRRVAFADNEYVKATENPTAQGAVAAQVRRETESPPAPGRAPVRTVRRRLDEDELPPPRARARTISLDETIDGLSEAAAEDAANPWGAEPGRAPVSVDVPTAPETATE